MTPIDNEKIIEIITDKITDWYVADQDHMPSGSEIAKDILQALSSSGYIICQASDAETGEAVSRKSALQSDDGADALKEALFRQTQLREQYQEEVDCVTMFLDGNGVSKGDAAGQFSLVGRITEFAKRQLEEAQADTATED